MRGLRICSGSSVVILTVFPVSVKLPRKISMPVAAGARWARAGRWELERVQPSSPAAEHRPVTARPTPPNSMSSVSPHLQLSLAPRKEHTTREASSDTPYHHHLSRAALTFILWPSKVGSSSKRKACLQQTFAYINNDNLQYQSKQQAPVLSLLFI